MRISFSRSAPGWWRPSPEALSLAPGTFLPIAFPVPPGFSATHDPFWPSGRCAGNSLLRVSHSVGPNTSDPDWRSEHQFWIIEPASLLLCWPYRRHSPPLLLWWGAVGQISDRPRYVQNHLALIWYFRRSVLLFETYYIKKEIITQIHFNWWDEWCVV